MDSLMVEAADSTRGKPKQIKPLGMDPWGLGGANCEVRQPSLQHNSPRSLGREALGGDSTLCVAIEVMRLRLVGPRWVDSRTAQGPKMVCMGPLGVA